MAERTELRNKIVSELPTLTGSEKQIAWADKIRDVWYKDTCWYLRDKKDQPIAELRKLAAKHDEIRASEWIDNRKGAAQGKRGY